MKYHSRSFNAVVGKLLTAALAFVATTHTTQADIHTWTGTGANKLWSNPTNWQAPAGAPSVGEAGPVLLSFPSGVAAAALRSTNDIANLRVDTIALNGDNYHLGGIDGGNSLTIGIGFLGSGNSNQIESSLALVFSNTVVFNLSAGAELTIQSVISGPGGLWQTGEGSRVRLSGPSANIYGGITRVDGGTLELQNGFFAGTVAVPGPLIIGSTNGNFGVVRYLADDQIADSSTVSIYGDSYLYLEGHNDTIGSLDMIGATIYTDDGLLSLNGGVTYHDWPAFDGAITGRLGLGFLSRTFDIISGELNITARIESIGNGGIIKEGTNGVLGLWGTNTYAGHTTINAGRLNVRNNSALGVSGPGMAGTTVNPGGELQLFNGFAVTGEFLQLNSKGIGGASGGLRGSGTCSWNADVTLLGDSAVLADTAAFMTINGAISGSYSFTKTGLGILRFSGATDNTYNGGTFVNQGVLQLAKTAGQNAVPGSLTIGDDIGGTDADVVRLLAGSQIPDDALITINSSGLLDLNAQTDIVGPITFNGGHLDSGNPTTSVWLSGDLTINANSNAQATIDGGIFFYGNTNRTFNTVGHYYSPDLRVRAFVSGQATAALVKTGVGEMGLYHTNNTYSGPTIVQRGSLQLNNGCEPGSTANGTIVSNGAQIVLFSGARVGNESLTLYGNSTNATAYSMFSGFGSNSWDGPVTLADDAAITVLQTNDTLNLSGSISGPGGLTKIGAGMLRFSGGASNSFAGGMFVNAGVLILAHTNETIAVPGPLTIGDGIGGANADEVRYVEDYKQIRREAHVHINSSGWLNFAGFPDSVGRLTGNGPVNLGNGGNLAFGFDNSDFTYNGLISGTGAVSKYGTGTATLTANSPFTGFLIPQFGTLLVNGTLVNADASMFNASILGGSGQVRSILARNGTTVSPGSSPGQLSVSQGVTCMPGSTYKVEVNGGGAGTTYDQIAMNGVLNLTNAVLELTMGFNSAPGSTFLIINNYGAGAVNGTFAGLPQNGIVTVNGANYRISYTAGSGNDVSLTHINTGPILTNLNASPTGKEGSPISMTGTINDPDTGDTVRLIVNWGDGSAPQTNSFPGGTNAFSIQHTYTDDNPTTTPQDTYSINAYLQDATGAISPALNDIVTISNVAPVVNIVGTVGLRAGQSLTNSGSFTDPGTDSWSGTVDYGDGSGTQTLFLLPNKTFAFNHTYPSNGVYNVRTIVRDDDQGSGTNVVNVIVGLQLKIANAPTNQVALSWPLAFSGFTLQSSTNLMTSNWVNVTNQPGFSGGNWIVELPATNGLKYYRLLAP